MASRLLGMVAISCLLVPAPALADDLGFFAGLDLSAGTTFGSSTETDGGAAFAGGGVVGNIDFGWTEGLGGHVGYRFTPALSALVSYQYMTGDLGWTAAFPAIGEASAFKGAAVSNLLMGNLAYDFALSDSTVLRTSAGAGLALNALRGVVETDVASGSFLDNVADHTRISPAARVGAGIEQQLGPDARLALNASLNYRGAFETGETRTGNAGVTSITPYRIDNVWGADLSASLDFDF